MITARGLAGIGSVGLALVAGTHAADRDIAWAHSIELADPTPYLRDFGFEPDANGQLEVAATDLQMHRHTMRNRMRRMGALLAGDLESAVTRAHLWLAINARELLAGIK